MKFNRGERKAVKYYKDMHNIPPSTLVGEVALRSGNEGKWKNHQIDGNHLNQFALFQKQVYRNTFHSVGLAITHIRCAGGFGNWNSNQMRVFPV